MTHHLQRAREIPHRRARPLQLLMQVKQSVARSRERLLVRRQHRPRVRGDGRNLRTLHRPPFERLHAREALSRSVRPSREVARALRLPPSMRRVAQRRELVPRTRARAFDEITERGRRRAKRERLHRRSSTGDARWRSRAGRRCAPSGSSSSHDSPHRLVHRDGPRA